MVGGMYDGGMSGGGMHGREACLSGGMHGRGRCAWQGGGMAYMPPRVDRILDTRL